MKGKNAMKEFIKSKFPEMNVRLDARLGKPGHKIIIEVLIFALVFIIANTIEGIPMGIITSIILLTDQECIAAVGTISLDFSSLDAMIDKIKGVTDLVTQKVVLPMLFLTAVVSAVILIYCTKIEKRPLRSLGIKKGNGVVEYLVGLAAGFAVFSAAVGICAATGSLKLSVANRGLGLLPLFFLGYMLQGFSEELMCRGFLMMSISRTNSLFSGVIVNSLVFAALHLLNPGIGLIAILNLFLYAVFASVYFLKRGNIWGVAAFHSVWNFVQGNFYGIQVSGLKNPTTVFDSEMAGGLSKLFNGGSFGLEGGLGVTIVLLVGIVVFALLIPAKKSEIAPIPAVEE